jgi:hypothetical protein
MSDKAEFTDVDLGAAHVGGQLNLSGSKVSGRFGCSGLEVMRQVFMGDRAIFGGPVGCGRAKIKGDIYLNDGEFRRGVDLSGAEIGGRLGLVNSKVTRRLDMNGLQVVNLLTADKAEFTDVDLAGAHVGGQLSLSGSKVANTFGCYGLEVGQQVLMNAGAVFGGPIDCRAAKIKGDFYLNDGEFKHDVDFTGAEIGGELHIGSVKWQPDMTLTLRNAKIDLIPALADARAPKLDIDGFTYRGTGAPDQFAQWFRKLDRYAPQPYDRLASVVQSHGNATLANAIRYSGKEHERSEAEGVNWIWLSVLRSVIGYGYYPQQALLVALYLVLIGTAVMQLSKAGPRNRMPFGFAYSFDILLPIIKLREWHYKIDLQPPWVRYYFYCHKIMGYVLASFLIAGLAGLSK